MKNIVLAIAMVVSAGVVSADWEDAWNNPDLNSDGPFISSDVIPSTHDVSVALNDFSVGNPDIDVSVPKSDRIIVATDNALTALEVFNQGNGDQYSGDDSLLMPHSDSMVGQIIK